MYRRLSIDYISTTFDLSRERWACARWPTPRRYWSVASATNEAIAAANSLRLASQA